MIGKPYVILLQTATTLASMFYHEPSHIVITPIDKHPDADFGLSITYQNGTPPSLVVGSPHSDLIGQVYSCPLDNILSNKECHKLEIDVKALSTYYADYNEHNKKYKYCLGATVAATSKYVFTCAPLWMSTVMYPPEKPEELQGPYGTCFIYYDKEKSFRFDGLLEQYTRKHQSNKRISEASMYGGIGWSSLVDESTGLIFIGKPAVFGDIQYIYSSKPLQDSQSMKSRELDYFTKNPNNIGYAFAAGRFFRHIKENVYAFSLQDIRTVGKVSFLQYNRRINVELSSNIAGNLYGAALCGTDLDSDGATDLLVGAPAQKLDYDEEGFESGAVYVHLGGNARTLKNAICVIYGEEDGSRFGAAIAAIDLDGDTLPEIIISAPYEISGVGALYIISGFQLNNLLTKLKETKYSSSKVYLSELTFTQRVQMNEFKSLGFSLQVVPDIDNNGCDELAVGVPRNATVVMLRCVPTINATISTKLVNEVVKENDKNFTVEVCVVISYPLKPAVITTKLSVYSEILGSLAKITENAKFDVDLLKKTKSYCEQVFVEFERAEQGLYRFSTKLESNIDNLLNKTEFESTWVRLSLHSRTNDSFEVTRHCAGADCTPKLDLQILWAGSVNATSYQLGSSSKENVTISVVNKGGSVYDACVRLRVIGAQVLSIPCGKDETDVYTCYLKKPLVRNDTSLLDIILNMARATNAYDKLHIEASLYNNCNHKNATKIEKDVELIFDIKNITITGFPHHFNMSDTEILHQKLSIMDDTHEFKIVNNGSLYWKNVDAFVSVPKTNLLGNQTISTTDNSPCVQSDQKNDGVFKCKINLPPNMTTIVILNTQILRGKIAENVENGQVEITSTISIYLRPTETIISQSQTTTIFFSQQLSIGNDKATVVIISIILAIIFLALIALVLYKVGFFKRKERTRLESLRESINRSTASNGGRKSDLKGDENVDDFNIDIVDDCPFEPVDAEVNTTADDAALIIEDKELKTNSPTTSTETTTENIVTNKSIL